ncbi:MAG TPA: alpha/beta hydrolase [Rhizomicrobium sp.]|jgi:pimeloyl-ACP methyl ester carboxylesterase|nr:alpha/beta hydrolase [Rhizomicrobium sp.]
MTQFVTAPDGTRIAYEVVGEGQPVLLVHGFAASRVQNWKDPGWYETLTGAGYRVIAMDCRGHGESDKPHDPARYAHDLLSRDVMAVIEAVAAEPVFLMGYSMGGYISIHVMMARPELLRRVVIGGVGAVYLKGGFGPRAAIADALLEPDDAKVIDPTAKAFRLFAGQKGKDVAALAACMRAQRKLFDAAELSHSTRPVLVVCGENDTVSGPPGPLAAAFADGRAVVVPRRDHMTAVGDKIFKKAALDFLAEDAR